MVGGGGEDQDVWIAFEVLYRIEWTWNISRDYLRKKYLTYDSAENCARSALLLGLHSLRGEVNNLEPKQKRNKYAFFCDRSSIKASVDKVLQKIYDSSGYTSIQFDGIAIPYAIELKFEDNIQLRLLVKWASGIIQVCHIHSFQDDNKHANNIGCVFVTDLINSPGQPVRINSKDSLLDENAKEYLRRAGIKGILAKFFVREAKADMAIFNSAYIVLEGKPEAMLKKLCNAIQVLETVKWR